MCTSKVKRRYPSCTKTCPSTAKQCKPSKNPILRLKHPCPMVSPKFRTRGRLMVCIRSHGTGTSPWIPLGVRGLKRGEGSKSREALGWRELLAKTTEMKKCIKSQAIKVRVKRPMLLVQASLMKTLMENLMTISRKKS